MREVSTIRWWSALATAGALLAGCGTDALYVVPTVLQAEGDLDFGTVYVDQPVERTLLLSAPHGAVSVSGIASDEEDLAFDWGEFAFALGEQEAEVVVTWTPRRSGTLVDPVVITSDADDNPLEEVAVTGTAIDPINCFTDNPCIEMVWDPIAETCTTTYLQDPCDDGDICTVDDSCAFGYCQGRFNIAADPSCDPVTCTPGATVTTDPFTGRWVEEIWASGPNNIWVAGADGVIVRWDGQNWSVIETCTQEDLYSIWGTAAGDIWAVGRAGTILHWDGDTWTTETPPTDERLWGVWADDDAGVWVVGDGGSAFRRSASGWDAFATGTDLTLFSVWGANADRVWAVGDLGAIVYWNGATWTTQQSFVGQELYAVRGLSATDVVAVGGGGSIVRFDGSTWSEENSETTETLFAVGLVHSGEYWVSGHKGVMRHQHYGTWDDHSDETGANMYALWANSSADVWLGGSAGNVWHWGGSNLTPQP